MFCTLGLTMTIIDGPLIVSYIKENICFSFFNAQSNLGTENFTLDPPSILLVCLLAQSALHASC